MLWVLWLGNAVAVEPVVSKIAFGSCADQEKPQPIWESILAVEPDLFVFLGDNVYGDTEDMEVLAAAYAGLAAQPGFVKLREAVPILAIWDDHDFGADDAGREYPKKAESKSLFLDFFGEPPASDRRRRDGLYTAVVKGPQGKRLQIVLPDLRWFRSPLATRRRTLTMRATNVGGYIPQTDLNATLLGEAQWSWLETVLKEPADLRILASSSQVLAEQTGWEGWANFPLERERLLDSLAGPTLIVSGDMHWAEMSSVSREGRVLHEMTTSGLTKTWHGAGPNVHRVGPTYGEVNFGLVTVDWVAKTATMQVRDGAGSVVLESVTTW